MHFKAKLVRYKKNPSRLRLILIFLFILLSFQLVFAQQYKYTSNLSGGRGAWSAISSWTSLDDPAPTIPADGDTVVILSGDNIYVDTTPVQIDSLDISGILEFTGNGGTAVTFTNDGNVVITGSVISNADGTGGAIHTFNVFGDLTGTGSFDGWEVVDLGDFCVVDVDFNGTAEQVFSLSGSVLEFYRFIISNTNSSGNSFTTTGSGNYNVYSTYTLGSNAGVVDLGSRTVTMDGGNFIVESASGSLDAGTSEIRFIGGSARKIQIDFDQSFYSVNNAKTSGTFTLEGDGAAGNETFTITGILTLDDVDITLLGADIDYGVTPTATILYTGTADVGVEWTSTLAPANVTVNTSSGLDLGTIDLDDLIGNLTLTSGAADYSLTGANTLVVEGNVIGGGDRLGRQMIH